MIGIPDDYRGEAAKAFIKLRADAKPFGLDELRAFLAGKIGKHELPVALDFVDELPRTPVGKLSRPLNLPPSPEPTCRRKAGPYPKTRRSRNQELNLSLTGGSDGSRFQQGRNGVS